MNIEIRNINIVPSRGVFADVEIDNETAKKLVANGFVSRLSSWFFAHAASELLGVKVGVDVWDVGLCNENVVVLILEIDKNKLGFNDTLQQIEAIGYKWRLISPIMRMPKAGDEVFVYKLNGYAGGKISDKGVRVFTDFADASVHAISSVPFQIGETFVDVEFGDGLYGSFRLNEIELCVTDSMAKEGG